MIGKKGRPETPCKHLLGSVKMFGAAKDAYKKVQKESRENAPTVLAAAVLAFAEMSPRSRRRHLNAVRVWIDVQEALAKKSSNPVNSDGATQLA